MGLEGLEQVWIRRGFQESTEEIVEMAEKMLREGIFSLWNKIVPLLSDEIMAEYEEVLRRKIFPFQEEDIQAVTEGIRMRGVFLDPDRHRGDAPPR